MDVSAILPPPMTRAEQLATILVRDEAARPDTAVDLAAILCDRLRWPAGGGVPVVLGIDGQPRTNTTAADLIREARAAHPSMFAGDGIPAPKPAPTTLTERVKAEHTARQDSAKAAEQADTSNPYRAATRNLTRQAILEKRDPAKAARLKSEAHR